MPLLTALARFRYVFAAVCLAVACLVFVTPTVSDARAGGGQSYGGGSRSSSSSSRSNSGPSYSGPSYSSSRSSGSGSSGGDAGAGFVVAVIIIVIIIVIILAAAKNSGTKTFIAADDGVPLSDRTLPLHEALARLKALDANFSETLFFDFVQLLYARVQVERGGGNLDALQAFVSSDIMEQMQKDARARGVTKVDEVLVGSSRILALEGLFDDAPLLGVQVEIEGNFTEHAQAGATHYYARERWTFRRKRGALSKPPGQMSNLSCPSCGSPSEVRPDGSCPYCDRVVAPGDFQWMLAATKVQEVIASHRPSLTSTAPEEGTDFPDVIAPDYDSARAAFLQRSTGFDEAAFQQRVATCFLAIQDAWSSGKWEKARPFETDHLFNTHRYWIEQYKRQGLANRLDDVRIARQWTVRYAQDAFYDSITVRIHASLRDYVVDAGGRVVGGDQRSPRAFSEYWTFIRTAGAAAPVPAKEGACPNCGAPLEVSMAGDCAYCGSKVTSGQFDWVLSAIEQDESYGKEDVAILPGTAPAPPAPPTAEG